jgi:hypothetical protein
MRKPSVTFLWRWESGFDEGKQKMSTGDPSKGKPVGPGKVMWLFHANLPSYLERFMFFISELFSFWIADTVAPYFLAMLESE